MAVFKGWPEGHINVILCKTLRQHDLSERRHRFSPPFIALGSLVGTPLAGDLVSHYRSWADVLRFARAQES